MSLMRPTMNRSPSEIKPPRSPVRSHPPVSGGVPAGASASVAPKADPVCSGLHQYPAETFSPWVQISPMVPSGHGRQVSASTIRTSGETGMPYLIRGGDPPGLRVATPSTRSSAANSTASGTRPLLPLATKTVASASPYEAPSSRAGSPRR